MVFTRPGCAGRGICRDWLSRTIDGGRVMEMGTYDQESTETDREAVVWTTVSNPRRVRI